MSKEKTLTLAIMDPPFESARSLTAFRLIDAALRANLNINVFAYEGAVCLPFAKQQQHANSVHGRDVPQENHPLPKDWLQALQREAQNRNLKLDWVNCGLCVDERGAGETIPGVRRGSPADFWKMTQESRNTLVIGTN
jgi:tRNA 2-thiouridine synthesizing protein D